MYRILSVNNLSWNIAACRYGNPGYIQRCSTQGQSSRPHPRASPQQKHLVPSPTGVSIAYHPASENCWAQLILACMPRSVNVVTRDVTYLRSVLYRGNSLSSNRVIFVRISISQMWANYALFFPIVVPKNRVHLRTPCIWVLVAHAPMWVC